jgi:regulator of PEP synthase PpsR (kinase-PPPase family)
MRELGAFVPRYADREAIEQELEEARALMRRIGCIVIRTDNRAVEESAQEILRYLDASVTTED